MPRATNPTAAASRHPDGIADLIVNAIMAGRIAAGQRLGEQTLADLFGVSRTLVREALARLSARGIVEVSTRRGWYVIQPSMGEAHEAFQARAAIETGLVHALPGPLPAAAVKRLKKHVADERAAIRRGDPGERSYLLGDFHVCFAECVGNPLLADILKDLTARTTLIAALYQSNHDAARSCADHAQIVAALEAGDQAGAARLVREHILDVANHLRARPPAEDPVNLLRSALWPTPTTVTSVAAAHTPPRATVRTRRKLFSDLVTPVAKPPVSVRRPPKEH